MRRRAVSVASLAAVGLLALWPVPADAQTEKCGICHPRTRVAFEASVHARENVGCTNCHRGAADAIDAKLAHAGDFTKLDDRRRIPRVCAECHSDLTKMRPFNLPVDQYAIYQTSQHGIAVALGETEAAVCIDCHGSHEIRGVGDPLSPVHARNVDETCERCHGDKSLMVRHEINPGVVEAYRSGIHGIALLDQGNAGAPTCSDCHGAHGAAPPGVGDINKLCGACHVETRMAFLAGPHGSGMLEAGLPECASCHLNHAIRRFDAHTIEALCAQCHGSSSDASILGKKIHTLLDAASEEVDNAERLIARAEQVPLDVDDYLGRIEQARSYLTEAAPLVHTVTLAPIEQATRRARSIGEEVQHEIYPQLDRRVAHFSLVLFWFYLLMTLAVLVGYKQRVVRGNTGA